MNDDALTDEDWKAKYEEVMETVQETEQELQEFQVSSKELEEELGRELELAEKAKEDMQRRLDKAENERVDWKNKFMSLQSTHTTTANSLQRELEALRESNRLVKVQLRELEMGNDDLERHERAVVSSLEDLEQKYSKILEEKILLEHDLQDRAALEESMQRLKDELRDAQTEISVLQEKLEKAVIAPPIESPTLDTLNPDFKISDAQIPPLESLLQAPPPDELKLSDLVNDNTPSPPAESDLDVELISGQSALLRKAGFASTPGKSKIPPSPSASPSRLPGLTQRRPLTTSVSAANNTTTPPTLIRPTTQRSASVSTTASALAARSRGMQMVSDMRSRVKTLEQRIQNRVPRLRKVSTRVPPPPLPSSKEPRSSSEKEGTDPGWVFVKDTVRVESRSSTSSRERVTSPPPPSAFKAGGLSGTGLRPPSRTGSRPKSMPITDPKLDRSSSSNPNHRTRSSLAPFPAKQNDAAHRPVTPTMPPVSGGLEALQRSAYGRRSSLGASTVLQLSASNTAPSLTNGQPPAVRTKPTSSSVPSRPPLPSMLPSPKKSPPTRVTSTTTVTAVRSSEDEHQDPLRPGSNLGMSSRHLLGSSRIGRPSSLTHSTTIARPPSTAGSHS